MRNLTRAVSLTAIALLTLPVASSGAAELCSGRAATITAAAPGPVQGTDGADVIVVTGSPIGSVSADVGPTVVQALGGDDLICLSSNAANVVIGGDGVDTVSYERSVQMVAATMNGAAVRVRMDLDTLSSSTLVATAVGLAPGVDLLPQVERLTGSPQDDVLIGHVLEADVINGGLGDDIIVGLFGNDQLSGQAGADIIVGDGYDEVTYGPIDGITVGTVTTPVLALDDDLLDGGAGTDTLIDDTEDNVFRGGDDNDGISPGFGDDTIDGGAGNDMVSFVQRAAFVDLTVTTPQNTGHGMDKLTSIEDLSGSDQADTFIGTPGVNVLLGGPGDDRIAGAKTASTTIERIDGGEGMDVCHGFGTVNCECPNATVPACSQPPYNWTAANGVGSPT